MRLIPPPRPHDSAGFTLVEVMDFSVSVDSPGFRPAFFPPAFSEFKKSFA